MNCGDNKPKKRNLFKRTFQKIRYKIEQYFERKKPSRFELWAKNELELIEKGCEDAESLYVQKKVTKDIMDIVKIFANQGHSGFSASYTLNLIRRLLDWKPIKPLTGEDDEWGEVEEWDKEDNSQQNKRCSAVFRKNFDNSTAYYLYGKIFSDDGGMTWFTKRESFVPITFPYKVPLEPEYIYLDKEDNEITKEQAKELFKEKESEVNE
jgi:hypothetical protein